jgi:hypothetical protein
MEQKDFMSMGFACNSRAVFTGKVPENTHSLKAELLVETGIEVIPPSPPLCPPPLFRLSLDTRRLHHSQLGVGIFAGCSR